MCATAGQRVIRLFDSPLVPLFYLCTFLPYHFRSFRLLLMAPVSITVLDGLAFQKLRTYTIRV